MTGETGSVAGDKEYLLAQVMLHMRSESDMEDETVLKHIDQCIREEAKKAGLPVREMLRLRQELFHSLRRLDLLSELLEDDQITEIMINGYANIFVERNGRLEQLSKSFANEENLWNVIQKVVSDCNRKVNASQPVVDARLQDGSRVNVVLPPVSLNGATMTIRRFPKEPMTMERLLKLEALSREAAVLLEMLVQAGYNIFISGGTGSGKTTFLNALSGFIPDTERVITIEDAAELQLQDIPNLVRLESRDANVEGENAVTIKDLIKASLRMRPDRLIVGEVRDGAALDMLTAMNTGHDGSLSTGHANSALDMLRRLETMVLMAVDMPVPAIQSQIASAIDIVVHLGRLRDKRRCVLEICEVLGVKAGQYELRTLFRFQEDREREKEEGKEEGKQTENRVEGKLYLAAPLFSVEKLKKEGLYGRYQELFCGGVCPAG